MSAWTDRILAAFPVDVARLWIAADPDDVLLDEAVLGELRARGFELMPFDDSIVFRAVFEERFRQHWDLGEQAAAKALVLHLRVRDIADLPADYLRDGRRVDLSLADLFPKLSYAVLRQLDPASLGALYDAHDRFASQPLGDSATREFVLMHIHRLSPHLIARPEEFWRELLRLHYRGEGLPLVLAAHMAQVLSDRSQLKGLPVAELFASKSAALRVVQGAWARYLERQGLTGVRIGEEPAPLASDLEIPFAHPDVLVFVDSLFLDGSLHPLVVQGTVAQLPAWAKVGVVQDPGALRDLVALGVKGLGDELPGIDALHREWGSWARRFGELLARFHALDAARAESVTGQVQGLRQKANDALLAWCRLHFGDLPSLGVVKAPAMVHHVPRFLSSRRHAGEAKVALVVFDGLAIDQWSVMRECLVKRAPKLVFDEGATFAWLPTLTSVSRQALFSGLQPREFADSIENTSAEPKLWKQFWLDPDQGLTAPQVAYAKSLKRKQDLAGLDAIVGNPGVRALGLVVDMVDEIVHGALLGKRGVAKQIEEWCDTGFIDALFTMLLDQGFHVYLTADHGNVEAVGVGSLAEEAAADLRGERVRAYRSAAVLAAKAAAFPGTVQIDVQGLPTGFLPLYAGQGAAFVPIGSHVVVHGGASVEELIVPFVKVSRAL
jgi:hypothetical protein